MNTIPRLLERSRWAAWLVLFFGLMLTYLTVFSLDRQIEQSAQAQFKLHVRDVLDSIEGRMRKHEQILLGGVGLFAASDSVTRADWHNYIKHLNLGENFPGIQGVGFSRVIKPAELNAHIAALRNEGFAQYTVRPSGQRALYTSIIYLEPFSGRNLAAFGFDMMSEATRAKAMRAAVEGNTSTITNKLKLVQETFGKEQAGLLMYLPVYRNNAPLTTSAQRWEALLGFVYSPYRVDDLMAGILNNRVLKLDFSIYDGTEETEDARMFVSTETMHAEHALMTASHTINVYGNFWTVRLNSRPEFEAEFQSPFHNIILVLGSGLSILLFLFVWFLSTRRERAEEIALEMTADIRENERKLQQSEARIHAIVEGAEHIIISTDTNGIIQSFNGAAERKLGYAADEVIGKVTPALFHKADEVVRRAQELTESGITVEPGFDVFVVLARNNPAGETREWSYIRKDGSTLTVSLTVTALHDESNEINAYLGIATDISEQIHARQMHRDDEARMAAILDNVLDGIITINEQGIVESFNKAAEFIFGYSAVEVVGSNVKMLMPEPYHSEHDGYLHNHVSTGKRKIIGIGRQVVGRRRDGSTFPMDLAVSAMQLGDKRMFTGIVRDITERVKTERMKSEFISTVSHELRTPLTSIRGSLGLIAGGVVGELPAQVRALIDIAHKNSERLILLVNDILDMEKIEAGKMEFIPAVTRLIPLLHQAIEANVAYAEQFRVHYQLADALPDVQVLVDINRFQQVLSNLLSNAAKFSPAGDTVNVTAESDERRVRVNISDHGSGISEQFRSQIFEKFSQADSSDTRKKGGTGLGLSITKAIVEQMGGRIGFDSQPDVLTTFWVEFPVWEAAASADSNEQTGKKRILLCEDDPTVASLLRNILEQAGFETDIASDALQARQMLVLNDYSAMTLNLGVLGKSGTEFMHVLRADKKTATLPVLVVSAHHEKGHSELFGDAFCIFDWMEMPIDPARLLVALKQAMIRSSSTRPRILHIEDDLDVCHVVNAIAGELAEIDCAHTVNTARQKLRTERYDLAILDISLPDGSGIELLHALNSATPSVPVMVFSAHEVGQDLLRQMDAALVKSRTDNEQLLETIRRMVNLK